MQGMIFPMCFFTKACWELVQTLHGSTLRTLELTVATLSDAGIIHDILCSLTGLEKLMARYVTLPDEKLMLDKRLWACLGPKYLHLEIDLAGGTWLAVQRNMMQRLGTLKRMRHMEVRQLNYHLRFRLDYGLEYLGGLQELRELYLGEAGLSMHVQNMKYRDIYWMLSNWPRLKLVSGCLHHDGSKNSLLKEDLERRGVVTEKKTDLYSITEYN